MSREEIMDDLHEPQQENYELEEFINEIRKYYKTHEFKGAKFFDCNASTSEEPTNQLPPRIKGRWIRHPEQKNIYGGKCVECSECGEKYVVQYIEDEKYCRNCGADMRENNARI